MRVDSLNLAVAKGERFRTIYVDPPWRYDIQELLTLLKSDLDGQLVQEWPKTYQGGSYDQNSKHKSNGRH